MKATQGHVLKGYKEVNKIWSKTAKRGGYRRDTISLSYNEGDPEVVSKV